MVTVVLLFVNEKARKLPSFAVRELIEEAILQVVPSGLFTFQSVASEFWLVKSYVYESADASIVQNIVADRRRTFLNMFFIFR